MRDETADVYARVHNRVDEILHYIWDPIGIAGVPAARDEYDSYIATVIKMLFDGADADQIARYLASISSERMGMTASPESKKHEHRVAEVLLDNYRWVSRHH